MALDLTVMEPGCSMGKNGETLELRRDGETLDRIPLHRIRSLAVGPGVGLSSDLLMALADQGTPVLMEDRQAHLGAVVFGPQASGLAAVRRAQARLAETEVGFRVARGLVAAKLTHQARLLRMFAQALGRTRARLDLVGLALDIQAVGAAIPAAPDRPALMGLEAQAARLHWQGVGRMVPLRERVHPGAEDLVNRLLNYGYGVLTRTWMHVVVQAGLDPHLGVLHADRVGRPGLVLDLLEPWRPWVDRTVVGLLRQGPRLEEGPDGLSLDTRHRLLEALERAFRARPPRHALGLREIWVRNARRLAAHFLGQGPWSPVFTHP